MGVVLAIRHIAKASGTGQLVTTLRSLLMESTPCSHVYLSSFDSSHYARSVLCCRGCAHLSVYLFRAVG
jgi:hypothetical protein